MLNAADQSFIDRLSAQLPEGRLRQTQPADLEEPRQKWTGRPGFVAMPQSTEEVARIVRECNAARVGIIPVSGGTGLVAGQIAMAGTEGGPVPLLVSLAKLTKIRAIYPRENAIVAEAGVTLAEVQNAAEAENRLFPLTYASKDTARIGGGLSANSGGLNVLRYGMARDLCLGIEAVLPTGEILHGLKRLYKDNTGYDLRHLLIGSEGTLGMITAAALKLRPRPAEVVTAFLSVRDPSAALDLLALLRDHAGETVNAFELIAGEGLRILEETYPDTRQPFDAKPDWSVLIELGMPQGADPEAVLAKVFELALDQGLVMDGRIATSGQQSAEMWAVRETMPEANRKIGAIASHDISLPLSETAPYIAEMTREISARGPYRINCFGHLGDGNLHFNLFPPKGESLAAYKDHAKSLTRAIHDAAVARGGSFSAEHGVGRAKVDDLERYADPAKLAAMRAIKQALDPIGIMNPGAVLKA